ncbi:hypothetical protein vBVpaMR16F_185 [Vibrio phage vB_VpaM_R16F]|nr:hypothetical protein vBVpaMR16F_185 [Vibrio phage vB_VpaM_R16F]
MYKYILVDRSSNSIKDYAVIVLDTVEGEDNYTWNLSVTDDLRDATLFNSLEQAVGMLNLVCNQPENWSVDIYIEEK